jgi:ABC-2 type transport system ATP-binding protein
MAVLLTTHDLDQAATLADRIGILDDGQLKAEGTFDELKTRTFAGRRQVTVGLASAPGVVGRTALGELRLVTAADDDRRWTGSVSGDLAEVVAIGARAAEAGLAVTELSMREPDLYGVYFKVTGRELVE